MKIAAVSKQQNSFYNGYQVLPPLSAIRFLLDAGSSPKTNIYTIEVE